MRRSRPAPTRPAPESAGVEEALRSRILGAAFRLLMERGYAGTNTLAIATRAKVSKRELYALFGNKRGILMHMVAMAAARMELPLRLPEPRDRARLATTLQAFGTTLIREVSSPAVLAVWRLALIEAERSPDVAEVLERAGREAVRAALAAQLRHAQDQGLLGRGDPAEMAAQFFALLWGDLMLRLLMRLAKPPTPAEAEARARNAAAALLTLYPVK